MNEKKFVDGMYVKAPSDRAPDFVMGKVSFNVERFSQWVRQWKADNPGEEWINVELTRQKKDPTKGSAVLDEWKPEKQADPTPKTVEEDDIPF